MAGFPAFEIAMIGKRPRTMELLLQHGADINAKGSYGLTSLMRATRFNQIETARLLLLHGADPNVQDHKGNTTLHYLVGETNPYPAEPPPDAKSLAPLLLAHGANPNLRNKQGFTALQLAQSKKRPDLVRLLKQQSTK